MTTYQKLKQENERLKKDIFTVVLNPDSIEALMIKTAVKISADTERLFLYGEGAAPTLKGLMS